MIKELEINKDFIKKNWQRKSDRKRVEEALATVSNFKNVVCYFFDADMFLNYFKGFEGPLKQRTPVDYGYGLTVESLEKYLNNNYGDSNSDMFFVTTGVMTFDYENYYKFGSFIDLNGENTHDDFYNMSDSDELEKKADIENH